MSSIIKIMDKASAAESESAKFTAIGSVLNLIIEKATRVTNVTILIKGRTCDIETYSISSPSSKIYKLPMLKGETYTIMFTNLDTSKEQPAEAHAIISGIWENDNDK